MQRPFRLGPSTRALFTLTLLTLTSVALAQRPRGQQPPAAAQARTAAEQVQVYQLTGAILDIKTDRPVPYVGVRVGTSRRRTRANEEGFFSIPVVMTDTLYFYSIGYKTSKIIARELIRENQESRDSTARATGKPEPSPNYNLYTIMYMEDDPVVLPGVNIYPYNTPSEIRTAMLNLPSGDQSAIRAARRNISPEQIAALAATLPVDEEERTTAAQQQYYYQYKNQGTIATAPIFDPIAVYRLIDYLGSKSRQKRDKKTYNYWPDED